MIRTERAAAPAAKSYAPGYHISTASGAAVLVVSVPPLRPIDLSGLRSRDVLPRRHIIFDDVMPCIGPEGPEGFDPNILKWAAETADGVFMNEWNRTDTHSQAALKILLAPFADELKKLIVVRTYRAMTKKWFDCLRAKAPPACRFFLPREPMGGAK